MQEASKSRRAYLRQSYTVSHVDIHSDLVAHTWQERVPKPVVWLFVSRFFLLLFFTFHFHVYKVH